MNPFSEALNDPYFQTLLTAALVFLVGHLAVSSTPLRGLLVKIIGEAAYLALYSIGAIAALWWLISAFVQAPYYYLWNASQGGNTFAIILMLPATFLVVLGLTSRNPTLLTQRGTLNKGVETRGVLRITRHPSLSGYILWALAHILAKGEFSTLVFFGAFGLLSLIGMFTIDLRRKARYGQAWDDFAAKSSRLPFGAIISGRNHLAIGELKAWRLGLATGVYLLLLFIHEPVFKAAIFK